MTTYRTAQWTWDEITEMKASRSDPYAFKIKENPAEGLPGQGLVRMIYRNPKSDDREVAAGKLVWIDLKEGRKMLLTQDGAGAMITSEEHMWCPQYKARGAWLMTKYLTEEETKNEFGVVSP